MNQDNNVVLSETDLRSLDCCTNFFVFFSSFYRVFRKKIFALKFFVKSQIQPFDDFLLFGWFDVIRHHRFRGPIQFHEKSLLGHTVVHRILSMISISIRRLFGICLLRGATPKKDKDIRKGRGKLNFYKSSRSQRYQKGRKSGYFVGWSSNGNNIHCGHVQ